MLRCVGIEPDNEFVPTLRKVSAVKGETLGKLPENEFAPRLRYLQQQDSSATTRRVAHWHAFPHLVRMMKANKPHTY